MTPDLIRKADDPDALDRTVDAMMTAGVFDESGSEPHFRHTIRAALVGCVAKSVTGPGRSGAVASVYASHLLGIPWIPFGQPVPDKLRPILIIDTASRTGRTLRWAGRKYETDLVVSLYAEPPRIRFWYETGEKIKPPLRIARDPYAAFANGFGRILGVMHKPPTEGVA